MIYNGIDPQKRIPDKDISQNYAFGMVGIFEPEKGQDKGIKYFQRIRIQYPNSKLHLFGDGKGKYKESLHQLVKAEGLEKDVVFHGFVKDLHEIYSKIDVLFMLSTSEGFGRVTVEAMLHGIPVMGYDNAGTSEIIQHGKTGFLFKDFETFEAKLSELTALRKTYDHIRFNALSLANEKFTAEKYCQEVENFINDLMVQKSINSR